MICLEPERLRKIATAVSGSLGPDAAKRVVYLEPDQFIADLKHIPLPTPAEVSEKTVVRRGYKVKRSLPQLTFAEQKQREDVTNRVLSEAILRKSS